MKAIKNVFFQLVILTSLFLPVQTELLSAKTLNSDLKNSNKLTIERINDSPSLDGKSLREMKLSPDGLRVTYLQASETDSERYDLWQQDVKSGDKTLLVDSRKLVSNEVLSDEEKARRERQRLFATGITQYFWDSKGKMLVFPLAGDVFVFDLNTKQTRQLIKTKVYETDVKLSPKDNWISFIREQNIWIINVKTGNEKQITFDGKGTIKNGMSEFVAQEEMSRYTGYWWSDDEHSIAYTQIDESPVAIEKRYEINANGMRVFEQRYPSTGGKNVEIKLAVVSLSPLHLNSDSEKNDNLKTVWLDLGEEKDIYLPRVLWFKDSKHLSVQIQSRDQQQLKLIKYSIDTGKQQLLLTETSDTWINLHKDLRFLSESDDFIWASERTGFKHLYRYSNDGIMKAQLTDGKWQVLKIVALDETEGMAYFEGTFKSPLERHLYKVSINSNKPQTPIALTRVEGVHSISFSKNNKVYIDSFSSGSVPPNSSLFQASGKKLNTLVANQLDKTHPFYPYSGNQPDIEFGTVKATDGQDLYYRIKKPKSMIKGKKYPVIVYVYGGPGAQKVDRGWKGNNDYWHQYMVNKGYIIFTLDNRGSTHRGKRFENPIYKQLGKVELEDQLKGINWLKEQSYIDADKIGVFGWSYGGYMTLMSMFKAPEVFKVGVSVAPVTDWKLYDTHYTERFISTPEKNTQGYEDSNVFKYISGLKGKLLLVHGMADDNVLYSNSTALYDALQKSNKDFSIMSYPGSKHSIWGKEVRLHLFSKISRFFDEHLK